MHALQYSADKLKLYLLKAIREQGTDTNRVEQRASDQTEELQSQHSIDRFLIPMTLEAAKIKSLPDSAYYIPDFITAEEEERLLQKVESDIACMVFAFSLQEASSVFLSCCLCREIDKSAYSALERFLFHFIIRKRNLGICHCQIIRSCLCFSSLPTLYWTPQNAEDNLPV